jgi:hypothetical protein
VIRRGAHLWLHDRETGSVTRVRVLRLWRWAGTGTVRDGVNVRRGDVSRVVVDYVGTRRTLVVWRDSARWKLSEGRTP